MASFSIPKAYQERVYKLPVPVYSRFGCDTKEECKKTISSAVWHSDIGLERIQLRKMACKDAPTRKCIVCGKGLKKNPLATVECAKNGSWYYKVWGISYHGGAGSEYHCTNICLKKWANTIVAELLFRYQRSSLYDAPNKNVYGMLLNAYEQFEKRDKNDG